MIKLLNYSVLELRLRCGRNWERTAFTIRTIPIYIEFGTIRKPVGFNYSEIATIKNPLEFEGVNHQTLSKSIGLDPKWSNSTPLNAVFINKGMPQRDRLIELNKIAIQQMKVLEGVEERRMLK